MLAETLANAARLTPGWYRLETAGALTMRGGGVRLTGGGIWGAGLKQTAHGSVEPIDTGESDENRSGCVD